MNDLLIPTERESFLSLLWNDVDVCRAQLHSEQSPTYRRQFFRAMFACIEGAVWLFKQDSLAQHNDGVIAFSALELGLLADTAADLNDKGQIRVVPTSSRFLPSILFTFRCHARAFGYEPVLHTGDHEWQQMRASVAIRNRLMHPKQLSSMDVSGDEIHAAHSALRWFGLNCSAATIGVSMWHAQRALQTVNDPHDRAARLQQLLTAANNLRSVVLSYRD